jgi:hypothetical protein
MKRPTDVTLEELRTLRDEVVNDPSVPELLRRVLAAGAGLESIVLDERGQWHHDGEVFVNERLSRLFHRSLRRTSGGTWLVEVPPYSYPVTVLGFGAFIDRLSAVAPRATGRDRVGRLSLVDWSTLTVHDDTTLSVVNSRGHRARLVGPAYQDVLHQIEADSEQRLCLRLRPDLCVTLNVAEPIR